MCSAQASSLLRSLNARRMLKGDGTLTVVEVKDALDKAFLQLPDLRRHMFSKLEEPTTMSSPQYTRVAPLPYYSVSCSQYLLVEK